MINSKFLLNEPMLPTTCPLPLPHNAFCTSSPTLATGDAIQDPLK